MNIALDFEYARPSEPDMGIISVSLGFPDGNKESYWLWKGEQKPQFLRRMMELREHTFIGYSIQQAEARCIYALGLCDPEKLHWRDLMLEWRWLRNGDNRYSYGKIMQGGFPRYTVPPLARAGKKASQTEIDEAKAINDDYLDEIQQEIDDDTQVSMAEAGWSMLDCCYFFGVIGAQGYNSASLTKKAVRDGIIIHGTDQDIEDHRQEILDYNSDDVQDILDLADAMTEAMVAVGQEDHLMVTHGDVDPWVNFDSKQVTDIQLGMGDWAARLAKYAHRGLPLHRGRLNRLLELVPVLKAESITEWNSDHPETPLYRIGLPETILKERKIAAKSSPYVKGEWTKDASMVENLIQTFCDTAGITDYPRTRSGKPDTSKKVIDRYAAGENLLKQYERHQGHLNALKTYGENPQGEVEALRYIGSDSKQRPDFGPYGTQTARNGAKAKSLCFLGPHWLRVLVDPEPGMAVIDCDFASEEVFIAGSLSDDANLKGAYGSNDVYVYYAQLTGMYPSDLPIPNEDQRSEDWFKPYKKVRNISKTLNLSMQFGAGAKSVAAAVRDATKDASITDEQGAEWVSDYREAYPDYAHMCQEVRKRYRNGSSLCLPDFWRMGPDNPSSLSAGNLPIQGLGTVILRRACKLIDDAGLTIIATLHDAITLYCKAEDAERVAKQASDLMRLASEQILGEKGMKVGHPEIVYHGDLWLHSERAQAAWDRLKKHFGY